jgi:hypothetical protein
MWIKWLAPPLGCRAQGVPLRYYTDSMWKKVGCIAPLWNPPLSSCNRLHNLRLVPTGL